MRLFWALRGQPGLVAPLERDEPGETGRVFPAFFRASLWHATCMTINWQTGPVSVIGRSTGPAGRHDEEQELKP